MNVCDFALIYQDGDNYYGYLGSNCYKMDQKFNILSTSHLDFPFLKDQMFYALKFGQNFFTMQQNTLTYFNKNEILNVKPLDREYKLNMLNFTYSSGFVIFLSNNIFYSYNPYTSLITEKEDSRKYGSQVQGLHSYLNELYIVKHDSIINENGLVCKLEPKKELLHKCDNILLFKDQNNEIVCFDLISKCFMQQPYVQYIITQSKERISQGPKHSVYIQSNAIFVNNQIITYSDNQYIIFEFPTEPDPYNKELCFKQEIQSNIQLNSIYGQLNKMIQRFRDEIEDVIRNKVQELRDKENHINEIKNELQKKCSDIAIYNQLVQINNSKLMNQYIFLIRRQEFTKMVQDGEIDFTIV